MEKIGLIYQPCGLGDILFLQKVAHLMKEDGYEVWWPVVHELKWLSNYIPDFNWVSWDDDNEKISGPPLPESCQFPYKEKYIHGAPSEIKDNLFFFQGFGDYHPVMSGKYDHVGVDWKDWASYIKFKRNKDKEDKLFYDVLGLKDGEKYVLVNRTFCTRPNVMYDERIPIDESFHQCKVVELNILPEYSIFDWCKVFCNADKIYTMDTSLVILLEAPEIYDIIKQKTLVMYHRPWGSWSEIDYLFNLPWQYQ